MSAKSDRAVVHLLGDIAQDERRTVLPSPGARVLPNLPITFTCEHIAPVQVATSSLTVRIIGCRMRADEVRS
jgi:hypothetical protein